jgi:hypothetical protein
VNGFEVHVDATARADIERAEVAARAHAAAREHARQSAGGKAARSGVHAARVSSAGGKANLGKIRKNYNKPNQTAHQQAEAARKRNERAAKRA